MAQEPARSQVSAEEPRQSLKSSLPPASETDDQVTSEKAKNRVRRARIEFITCLYIYQTLGS
jgi:hypothetical protein